MRIGIPSLLLCTLSTLALGEIHTETVPYSHGDTELAGYLAYDDQEGDQRPGVLIVHEWWGLNAFAKQEARRLAEAGHLAFALDMYGDGATASDAGAAGALAAPFYDNRQLARDRVAAGLAVLRNHPLCDSDRIVAIGFCFGGSMVLELARSGADLQGVASFHGGLATSEPASADAVRARVLVLHGADDPMVPDDEVIAFADEMRAAGADWQLAMYGGAVHSFTNPNAAEAGLPGVAYHEQTDRRAREALTAFFRECFR